MKFIMKFIRKLFGIKTKEEKLQLENEFNEMKVHLKEKVACLTKPAVHLVKSSKKTNSKFGGNPMVDSQEFIWPSSAGKPLTFLAQFDLNEVSRLFRFEWLPDSGSVLFFYDTEEMPWGFDPKDRSGWKVIYQKCPLIETEPPVGFRKEGSMPERYIEMRRVEILPPYEDQSIQDLNLSDEESDLYFELDEHFEEFDPYGKHPAHQIGGFPRLIQGDVMEFEAQQASTGIYMGDGEAYKKAVAQDFFLAKQRWQLLFQLDSDDELGAMWGDAGMLYFWVEKEKSKLNDFQNAWLILQCS